MEIASRVKLCPPVFCFRIGWINFDGDLYNVVPLRRTGLSATFSGSFIRGGTGVALGEPFGVSADITNWLRRARKFLAVQNTGVFYVPPRAAPDASPRLHPPCVHIEVDGSVQMLRRSLRIKYCNDRSITFAGKRNARSYPTIHPTTVRT